jgi:hypothetical protein
LGAFYLEENMKLAFVSNCKGCPYFESDIDICAHEDRTETNIPANGEIPDDCPLPDAPEAVI